MKPLKLIIWLLIVVQMSSCATPALWRKTDPSAYIMVSSDVITEQELQEKKIKYFKNEEGNGFLVEKNNRDKFKDYTYRTLGTPVAVAVDAAIVVLVVGIIASDPGSFLHSVFSGLHSAGTTHNRDQTESNVPEKKDDVSN